MGCATQKWTPKRFISKTALIRAYVYARQGALLWGSLASCGRLSIGQLPRLHRTAAVANRRAGCQPAPHHASVSTYMSRTPGKLSCHIEGVAASLNGGGRTATVRAVKADGTEIAFTAVVRVDTPQEVEYYRNGGILPYVLRQLAV